MDVHPKYPKWLPAQLRRGWKLSQDINKVYSSALADEMINLLSDVEGHTTPRQCATLFYFAYSQPCEGEVVEIGSFKGQSTVWIGQALKLRGKGEKVTAVDPHINTGDNEVVPQYEEESSFEAFRKNVASAGVSEFVDPIVATSEEAIKAWDKKIGMVFIDGSHRYEDVLLDLQLWEPYVEVGGIIIFQLHVD